MSTYTATCNTDHTETGGAPAGAILGTEFPSVEAAQNKAGGYLGCDITITETDGATNV